MEKLNGMLDEPVATMDQWEESWYQLQVILEIIPVGLLIIDANGRFLRTNSMFNDMWGGELPFIERFSELSSLSAWWSDTGVRLRTEDWGIYRAVRTGGPVAGDIIDVQRADGTMGTLVTSSAPIRTGSGEVVGAIAVVQDITRQRELEHIAEEALERNQLYIDILSHDINNLNAATLGYLQLLGDRGDLGEKERGWVSSAERSVDEVTRLIETMNRIQTLGSSDEARVHDLSGVIRHIKEEVELVSGRKIVIDYSGTEVHEVMATGLLQDIFACIIGNAIAHSTESLTIGVSIDTIDRKGMKYKQVSIEDDGPGIPDELKGTVFSRIKRGTTKGVGSGLGLYLVKRLVDGMGGEIRVEDRVPGDHAQGARFVVLLPAAPVR